MADKLPNLALDDEPSTKDLLGYNPYVDAMASVLSHPELGTPFAVGIFGRWGTGKSTFMYLLNQRLDRDEGGEFDTVIFQPWQFENKEDVWKGLIYSILDYLEQRAPQSVAEDELERVIATVKSLAIGVGKLMLDKYVKSLSADMLSIDQISAAYAETAKDNSRFINRFAEDFRILKDNVLGGNNGRPGRMFVFIDDLDRCEPENCIMVLEAMKLFFNIKGCVFILGIDREVVQKGIDHKYQGTINVRGLDYIEKMIQLPFSLPPIADDTFKNYVATVTTGYEFDENIKNLIIEASENNPRRVKRLCNCLMLTRYVALTEANNVDRYPNLSGGVDNAKLALLILLQVRYPVAYFWLARTPQTIDTVSPGWRDRPDAPEVPNHLVTFLKDAYSTYAEEVATGFLRLWAMAHIKNWVEPFESADEISQYMRIAGVVDEQRSIGEGAGWSDLAGRKFSQPAGEKTGFVSEPIISKPETDSSGPETIPAAIDDIVLIRDRIEDVRKSWLSTHGSAAWQIWLRLFDRHIYQCLEVVRKARNVRMMIEALAPNDGVITAMEIKDMRNQLDNVREDRVYRQVMVSAGLLIIVGPILGVFLGYFVHAIEISMGAIETIFVFPGPSIYFLSLLDFNFRQGAFVADKLTLLLGLILGLYGAASYLAARRKIFSAPVKRRSKLATE